jgi:repressor LexA
MKKMSKPMSTPLYHVERYKQVARFIDEYIQEKDYAPTHREIAEAIQLTVSRAHGLTTEMREKGLMVNEGTIRGLALTKKGKLLIIK